MGLWPLQTVFTLCSSAQVVQLYETFNERLGVTLITWPISALVLTLMPPLCTGGPAV